MARILTAACLALLCLGCDSGPKRALPNRSASQQGCGSAVVWHGVRYFGRTPKARPIPGRYLGPGGVPSCRDVLGGETGASRAVEVMSLVGADPRVAVTIAGDNLHAYFAQGRPRLPGHS